MASEIIPASELIINDDNTAFHLHLSPDQLRDKVVICGDPGRVNMIAQNFDSIDFENTNRG